MSEGHEVMLKAEGMLRENMGSSIWSRGNVVARSFLSARVGAMPRGRVRDGDRVRLSGLVSTIFRSLLSSLSQKLTGCHHSWIVSSGMRTFIFVPWIATCGLNLNIIE